MGIKQPARPFLIEDCIVEKRTQFHSEIDSALAEQSARLLALSEPPPIIIEKVVRDLAQEEMLLQQLVSVKGDLAWAQGEVARLKSRGPEIIETIKEVPTHIEKEIIKVVIRTPGFFKWLMPIGMAASYLIGKYLHL